MGANVSLENPAVATKPGFHLGYQPAIDGLRGFAVLAVFAKHLKLPFAWQGELGVDIFFTLSGFLITVLLVQEWKKTNSIHLGHFYMRRVIRLYPALLLMLLAVGFFTTAPEYILSSLTYSTNWLIALKIRPLNLELGHTWTLAIEEQYYLLWPLALRFMLKRLTPRKALLVPLGLALLSTCWRVGLWLGTHDFWRYNAGTDTHADGLFLGSALGLALVFGLLPQGIGFQRWMRAAAVIALLGMLWLIGAQPQPEGMIASVGITWVVLTTVLLVSQLVIYPQNRFRRVLGFAPLVMVGEISYGLYLWQVPVLNLVNLSAIGLDGWRGDLAKIVIIFLITFLSYRYLEKPILKLKARFSSQNPGVPIAAQS